MTRLDEIDYDALQHITTYVSSHITLVALSSVNKKLYYVASYEPAWEALCKLALDDEQYAQQCASVAQGTNWCGWRTTYSVRYQAVVMQKVVSFIQTTLVGTSRIEKSALKNLVNLDLSTTCIGREGTKKLAKSLRGNHILEKLDVSNQMMVESVTELVDVMLSMKRLRYVNLSDNRLGPDGANSLRRLMEANRLCRLDACKNFLGLQGAKTLSEASLKKPYNLCLLLDRNGFTDSSLPFFAKLAPKLSSLSLRTNMLTNSGLLTLAPLLKNVPTTFDSLDLSNVSDDYAIKAFNVIKPSTVKILKDACKRVQEGEVKMEVEDSKSGPDRSQKSPQLDNAQFRKHRKEPLVILSEAKKGVDSSCCFM